MSEATINEQASLLLDLATREAITGLGSAWNTLPGLRRCAVANALCTIVACKDVHESTGAVVVRACEFLQVCYP